eukprot:TRINITY_DN13613_c0_g1_i1.p1 TRINITY_DN13613_c0_g1~~TRINITY_DN13613_c0_g1_i1.p1  ORF type:complete len:292 (-),score=67.71 TRINITY_DN13613_c0_g1_i1:8-883(-)
MFSSLSRRAIFQDQHLRHIQNDMRLRTFKSAAALQGKYYSGVTTMKIERRFERKVTKDVEAEMSRMKRREARKEPLLTFYKNKAFKNAEFQLRIGFVLSRIPELKGKGLAVVKLKISEDAQLLEIFWGCSKSIYKENIDALSAILKQQENVFAGLMKEEFGECPHFQFVFDKEYHWERGLDAMHEKIEQELVDATEKVSVMDELRELTLENDAGELDRSLILKQLKLASEKQEAAHKHQFDPEHIKKFKEEYELSIAQHGAKEKKELRTNIKKFLNKRNSLKSNQAPGLRE